MHARNAEYNPKRFAAVIMRIRCDYRSCVHKLVDVDAFLHRIVRLIYNSNIFLKLDSGFADIHLYNPDSVDVHRDPKTTALIFGSGKMVCTGAKSEVRMFQAKYPTLLRSLD